MFRAGSSTTLRLILGIALLSTAVLTAACDGQHRLVMPSEGDVVSEFPNPKGASLRSAQASNEEAPTLRVASHEPKGEVRQPNSINVVFNQPMDDTRSVRSVRSDELPPLIIQPPVKGAFRWVGPRTASFVPDEALAPATTYTVQVNPSLKSLSGKLLESDYRFEFETPSLQIRRYDPSWRKARLKTKDKIVIQFNMPVRNESLKSAFVLERVDLTSKKESGYKPVPFTLTATDKDRGQDSMRPSTGYAIQPVDGFIQRSTYRLRMVKPIYPFKGQKPLAANWSRTFNTHGDFEVSKVFCQSYQGDCTPTNSWRLEFSNPVLPKDIAKCVSVSPRVEFRSYGYGNRVTLNPIKAKPGQTYTVKVGRNCKDRMGSPLRNTFSQSIRVGHYRPTISMRRGLNFMEKPAPGEKMKYPVTLRNTPDVHVRMLKLTQETITPFLTKYESWSGSDTLRGEFQPSVSRPFGVRLKQDTVKTYGVDLSEALGNAGTGVVYMDLHSEEYNRYYGRRNGGKTYVKTLAQVTDLGITAKHSPESVMVWVTSLATGKPHANVNVSMRSADNVVLWTGTTNAQGIAVGPGVKTFGKKKPRVVIASTQNDLSFVDLEGWGMEIRPYQFDLDYAWDAPAAEILSHVFTERGVYRPGESVHVKGYLRLDRGRQLTMLPTNTVNVQVKDSRGDMVLTQETTLSELGSFDFTVPLKEGAKLGTYSMTVTPVGIPKDSGIQGRGQGSFRVEAYRAPDFEVTAASQINYAVVGDDVPIRISGQYLFGAPMNGAEVEWSARRTESTFSPKGYDSFTFSPDADVFWWSYNYRDSKSLGDDTGKLDRLGVFDVKLSPKEDKDLQGPQRISLEATVKDINRRTVTGRTQVTLHPASFYIGLQNSEYLVEAKKPHTMEVVAVGLDGRPVAGKQVRVEMLRREWKSVRKQSAGGGFTWVSERKDVSVQSCNVQTRTGAEKASCSFSVPKSGTYVFSAKSKDEKGRNVQTSTTVYAYGGGYYWWNRDDHERIDLVADQKTYRVGDKARIMIKSPFRKAQALVTVERRGILDQRVIEVEGSAPTIEVPITPDFMPNAFVSVTLIRGRIDVADEDVPKDSQGKPKVLDPGKPAFKMGYTELNIDTRDQVIQVSIEPEKEIYRPGQTARARIDLRDANGQPIAGEVAFMAVDEGVLSLTAYKTPKPASVFFRRQPIAVLTAESRRALISKIDMADEEGMKGDAGGGGGSGMSDNFRSAFATTAAFLPTVKVGPEGAANVEFKLPDNLTAFRLMAVAVADGNRFGSGEDRITVQKPLMTRPALPRFLSAGDNFDLRTVVQAVGDAQGDVEVRVEVEGPVNIPGAKVKTVSLKPGEVREVAFPAQVLKPGTAKVRFKAKGKAFQGDDSVEMTLPVRYPSAKFSLSETGRVAERTPGSGVVWKRVALPDDIRTDVGGLDIELTNTALAELLPGLSYLIDYPYGCVEQTTGRTLPLVALRDLTRNVTLPGVSSNDVETFAQSGLDRLLSMQTYDGGLGYWPGASTSHPWGSAYGGLALIQASRVKGLNVPEKRLKRLKEYLRGILKGNVSLPDYWTKNNAKLVRPFAAYVLAVGREPEVSYHQVLFNERASFPNFGKAFLALAILEAGGDREMVNTLLNEMLTDMVDTGAEAYLAHESKAYTNLLMDSDVRSNAIALMTMLRARPDDELTARFARGLLQSRRGGRWVSTQDNAFAVLALGDYFKQTESVPPNYDAIVGLGDNVIFQKKLSGRGFVSHHVHIPMEKLVQSKDKLLSLVREGTGGPMYYSMKLSYVPKTLPEKSHDNGFTLMREYLAADGPNKDKPIKSIEPGQVVKVRLTLVVPFDRHYVAIEDPLPAGLEAINTSFATTNRRLTESLQGSRSEHDYWWYDMPDFDHTEQRDDRILLFSDFMSAGVYNHTYLARATSVGSFTVPAARVEEMYRPEKHGQTEAFRVEVK